MHFSEIKRQNHCTLYTFCYEEETLIEPDLCFRGWKKVHSIIIIHFLIQRFPREILGFHSSFRNIYFFETCYSKSHIFPNANSQCCFFLNRFDWLKKPIKFCWKFFDWFPLTMFAHGLNIYHEIAVPLSWCLLSSDIFGRYPLSTSVFILHLKL